MSVRWQLSHGPGAQRDVSARVRANTTSVRTNAEEGSVAISQVVVDDPAGDLEVGGLGGFYGFETESPSAETCFYRGFIADREISRGEDTSSFRTTNARRYAVSVADQNSIISRRIMLGSDANRPAETDVQRVRYLIGTPEMGHLDDDTYVNLSGGVAMDAADYRGQTAFDVLNDCAQASGKNFWVMFVEAPGGGGTFGLWYDHTGSTAYSSDIRISNVFSDTDETDAKIAAGTVTTFAASFDTKLVRDPHRVYSGVYMPYDGGAVYQSKASTASNFQARDTTSYSPNVKTAAKATARAIRYLNSIDTEEDRITTTIKVPNAQVNDLREGHRVECRFSHLPGYESFTWMRVLNRTVTQVSEYFYQITVEMSAEPSPSVAPLSCATALGSLDESLSDSGEQSGGPYGFTPSTPGSFPAVVYTAWAGYTTFTFLTSATGAGSGNVSAPYALLDEYTGNDEHTAYVVGYQALTSGAPGSFVPSWSLGNAASGWMTASIAIPTADTAPVQSGSQNDGTSGTVTLPAPPTAGNLLVLAQVCANSAGNPVEVPGPGWTRIYEGSTNDGGVSDLQLLIDCRCVGVGESNVIGIVQPAFFHASSVSEWTISGAVTVASEGTGSGAGEVAGGGEADPGDTGGDPGTGGGSGSGTPPGDTNLTYVAVNGDAMPGYLSEITDSTWGTKIRRITNTAGHRNQYARHQSWNKDQTRMYFPGYGGHLYNATTYADLGAISPGIEYPCWSNINADYLYGVVGTSNVFRRYSVSGGSGTNIHTFTGYGYLANGHYEGNLSDNDRVALITNTASDGSGTWGVLVYDIPNDAIISSISLGSGAANRPEFTCMSRSGTYVVIAHGTNGTGTQQGTHLYYASNFGRIRQMSRLRSHADPGRDIDGNDIYVYVSDNADGIRSHRMSNGTDISLVSMLTLTDHVSCTNYERNGWAYISCDQDMPGRIGNQQVYAVKTDGSGTVEVFGFTHQGTESSYDASPFFSANRTGDKGTFGGKWGGSTVYGFVAGVTT